MAFAGYCYYRRAEIRAMAAEPAGERGASASKKQRPPLDHTSMFETPTAMSVQAIGVIRSPYKERFGTPRQATVWEQSIGNAPQDGEIHLNGDPRYEHALRGLDGFDYCWVICWMHLNTGWNPLVTPPRGPRTKQGIFATRAPHRPNPISLSALKITSVDYKNRIVHVKGLDLLDGTPILDIKPYVPYADAFPNAAAGWLDNIEDKKGPDYLGYSPPPPHLRQKEDKPETEGVSGAEERT
ncbi:hypothetical protein NDN08_007722 [Rhodosorus marinus]|uniref:TsaA-like domain-containing protein n=1 Tax=Rhodosorus marinus TaxID=101924 RepID=A0AAV8V2K8_9RHOD|nr:hypothetical protein NDN08_007722 [Rhodosorus marinus]